MDEDTAKEIQGFQGQLTTLLNRKRKREDIDLEDKVKSLRERLTLANKKCSDATKRCTELSKKNKELQTDNKLLEKSNKEQQASLQKLNIETDNLEQENKTLRTRLKELQKYEVVSKNALSNIKQNISLALGAVLEVETDIDNNFSPVGWHDDDFDLIHVRPRQTCNLTAFQEDIKRTARFSDS
jgi:chromosome segregation ATPase